jgi:hypothetical protein
MDQTLMEHLEQLMDMPEVIGEVVIRAGCQSLQGRRFCVSCTVSKPGGFTNCVEFDADLDVAIRRAIQFVEEVRDASKKPIQHSPFNHTCSSCGTKWYVEPGTEPGPCDCSGKLTPNEP